MKVISFASFKGGQGRTTTAVSLAAFFSRKGYHTLLVDLDFQASATMSLVSDRKSLTLADVLLDNVPITESIEHTNTENLDIAVGDIKLADFDIAVSGIPTREKILKKELARIKNKYDVICIDTPPSLNLLTLNALMASNYLVIPITPQYLALEALNQFVKVINEIQVVNTELKILGILFTIADFRLRVTHEAIKTVREQYREKVFNSVIRSNVKLIEAPAWKKTIFQYAPESIGALSYERFGREVLKKW